MQAAKKGVLNVFYGLLGQIITICLGIIIPRLVLVSYGSEVNGLLTSTTQIFLYFTLFEAGVGVASLQALYAPVANEDKEAIQGIISATHRFYRKTGILYAAAVVIMAFVYPFFVKTELSYWVIVSVILLGGLGNCLNFLYQGKYKILMQAEGCQYVSTNITTIFNIAVNMVKAILLVLGFNVIAVQLSFFTINVLQMLLYYVYIRKHYSWINLKSEPNNQAISQKGATLVHQVSSMIFFNTDVLLLTILTQDLRVVSIYTMYNTIVSMVTTMINQVATGFDFRLGQMYNTDKKQYFEFHHVFEIAYLVLVFSAMSVVYIFILPFMRLYTSGVNDVNYINEWYPLIFVLVPLLSYGRLASSNIINYAGHFEKTKWRAILESAINIVVSIVGIIHFGIFGALIGTIAASLYRTNDMIMYAYKYLIKDNPWKTYKRWIASFAIFFGMVWFIDQDNALFSSYPKILAFGILYGVVCVVIYTVVQIIINPKDFKKLLEIIKGYYTIWKEKRNVKEV